MHDEQVRHEVVYIEQEIETGVRPFRSPESAGGSPAIITGRAPPTTMVETEKPADGFLSGKRTKHTRCHTLYLPASFCF
jgi:hypothetical protein